MGHTFFLARTNKRIFQIQKQCARCCCFTVHFYLSFVSCMFQLVIAEMNRLGMLVDIAHVSHKVMSDVLDVTKAPIISSHSTAYSICPHPRNTPDDILKRMVKSVNN